MLRDFYIMVYTRLRARVQSRRSKSLLSLYDAAKQFTKNQRMLVKAKYVCKEKKILFIFTTSTKDTPCMITFDDTFSCKYSTTHGS